MSKKSPRGPYRRNVRQKLKPLGIQLGSTDWYETFDPDSRSGLRLRGLDGNGNRWVSAP